MQKVAVAPEKARRVSPHTTPPPKQTSSSYLHAFKSMDGIKNVLLDIGTLPLVFADRTTTKCTHRSLFCSDNRTLAHRSFLVEGTICPISFVKETLVCSPAQTSCSPSTARLQFITAFLHLLAADLESNPQLPVSIRHRSITPCAGHEMGRCRVRTVS